MDVASYQKLLQLKKDPLAHWKYEVNRMKNSTNVIIDINCIGDSITQGAGSDASQSNWMTKGFVGQLRSYFNTKYGNVGTGVIPSYAVADSAPQYTPWTYTGTSWADTIGVFGFMGCAKRSNTSGETATITFNGTGVDVIMAIGTGITPAYTFTVDGGTPQAQTPPLNGGNAVGCYIHNVSGLSNGSHTLTITNTVSQNMYIIGIRPLSTANPKGVRVNMMGRSGKAIGDIIVGGGYDYPLEVSFDLIPPKLTIISMLANDYAGATTMNTYSTNLESLIKRAKLFGDVLLVYTGMRSDGGKFGFEGYLYTNKYLADKYNCAELDIYRAWGSDFNYAKNTLNYIADTVHPNYAGHTDIANRIISMIDV